MKVLVKYISNMRCKASSKKEAEKCLKPSINLLRDFCSAFGFTIKALEAGYQPGTGDRFEVGYLFSFNVYRVCEFRIVLSIADAINTFANLNEFEITEVKFELLEDE